MIQGNPGVLGKRLTEALEAEIKKSKQPPAGTPDELEKAWGAFLKGDVAAALAECDASTHAAAVDARAEFMARTSARLERIGRLIESGELFEAERLAAALEKGVKANAELATRLAEATTRICDPANAKEREASKAFAALIAKIATDKPFDAGNVKKMSALAEEFAGTKTAERAQRFVGLSKSRAGH